MANSGYDYTIKIGMGDLSAVNNAIKSIDTALNKQYTLRVDTSALSNITDTIGEISRALNNTFSANGAAARRSASKIQSLVNSLYSSTSQAKNKANFNFFDSKDKGSKTDVYAEKLEKYKTLMSELEANASNFKSQNENNRNITRNSQEYIDALTRRFELERKLKELEKELASDKYDKVNKKGMFVNGGDALKNIRSITEAEDKVKEALQNEYGVNGSTVKFGSISQDMQSITYTVTDADGKVQNFRATIDSLNGGLRTTSTEMGKMGKQFNDQISGIKSTVSTYLASIFTINNVIRTLKKGISVVREFDDAMTGISLTMNSTPTQMDNLGSAVIHAAEDMGTSISQALDVSKIYANMQTTPEEIIRLSTPTIELSNASGLDTATTSGYIQAVLNQFEMQTEDAEHVADVFENISANIKLDFAEGIKDIAEGVSTAGALVYESGMSFEKFAAIVAKTAEQTRQAGSQIGNQWKTILTRISKASGVSDEEVDTATLSKASESLHKIGIEVYNARGEYNNLDVILTELAQKWETLSDAQQADISFNLAATRNRNALTIALKSYEEATALATAAEEDNGTAAKNQETMMESYTAKLNHAGVEIERLYIGFLDNDITKFVIDVFSTALELVNDFIEAFGGIGIVITALAASKGLGKLAKIFNIKLITDFASGLSALSGKVLTKFTSLFVSGAGQISTFSEAILALGTHFRTLGDAIAASEAAGGGFKGFLAGVGSVIKSHPVIAGVTAVTAAAAAGYAVYKKQLDDAVRDASQDASEAAPKAELLQDSIKSITELKTALASGKLTEEEAYDAKSQLLSIQQQLTDSYGEQVSGIDLVNGSLETQVGLLKQISESDAQKFLNEHSLAISEAKKNIEQNIHNEFHRDKFRIGSFNADTESGKRIKALTEMAEYEDYFEAEFDSRTQTILLNFIGNPEEALSILNDFASDVRSTLSELGKKGSDFGVLQGVSNALTEANDIIGTHSATYNTAKQSELILDKNKLDGKTAAEWLDEYSDAVEDYNEALSSGDSKKMLDASNAFNSLKKSINLLQIKDDQFKEYESLFSNVEKMLNQTSEFEEQIKNAASGKNTGFGARFAGEIERIKNAGLSDIDFKSFADKTGNVSSDAEAAVRSLKNSADEAGVSLEGLSQLLVDSGVISGRLYTPDPPKDFKKLLKDESEEGFGTTVAEYSANMEKLTAAKEKLIRTNGKLNAPELKELLETVPELSAYMDDLESGIDTMIHTADNQVMDYFADQIKTLRDAGMDADASALETYAQSVVDSANEIEGAFLKISDLKIETPDIFNWENPEENSGSVYDKIYAGYETAKKAYENDEVGSPAFKAFAKMISPTGSDDAASFAENMSKFERYFQDGADGCKNFLKDLELLNLAEEENGKWTYKVGNNMNELKTVAEELGIGFEPMMAMFGKLEDFGFYNDFFVSEEEGTQHVLALYDELAQEKRHLAEIENNPNTKKYDTAIQASKDKITELEERIAQCNQTIEEMPSVSDKEVKKNAAYAISVAKDLIGQIENTENEELKQSLEKQLDDFAKEHHLVIETEIKPSNTESEAFQNGIDLTKRPQISTKELEAAGYGEMEDGTATVYTSSYSNDDETKTVLVTPILPDGRVIGEGELYEKAEEYLSSGKDDEGVAIRTFIGEDSVAQADAYGEALHRVHEAYYLGSETEKNALNTLKKYDAEMLRGINYTDGVYDVNAEAEKAVDSLMRELGLSTDQVQQFINVMEDMGLIPSHSIQSLEEAASNINGIEIDFNAEGEDLDSQIALLSEKVIDPEVDTTELEAAKEVLTYLIEKKQELSKPEIMNYEASDYQKDPALSGNIEKIQEFQNAYNELEKAKTLNLDGKELEAVQKRLEEARSALKEMPDNTELSFSIEGKEDAEIISQIASLDLSILEGVNKLSYEFEIINEDVLDEVLKKLEKLKTGTSPTPIKFEVPSETNFLNSGNLTPVWNALEEAGKNNPNLTITVDGVETAVSDLQSVSDLLELLTGKQNPLMVESDTEKADAKLKSTQTLINGFPNIVSFDISARDNASATLQGVETSIKNLDGKTATVKVVTEKTTKNTGAAPSSAASGGAGKAHGTPVITSSSFHNGHAGTLSARAQGSWGEQRDTKALTGELGRELIVRGNHFFTVGDNGAEMVNLKKGDIVFNHKQTEDILTKGYTIGRGRALVQGNARSGGGTFGGNKYSTGSSSASNSNQKSSSKSKDSKDKNKKDDSYIDWIEKAISRLERKIKNLKNAAENIYRLFSRRNKKLTKEISAVSSEIDLQKKAYKRYLAEAKKVKLSSGLKKKVRKGTVDINKYGEKTKKQIDDYAQWYEKALACKDAVKELNRSLSELYRQQFDNIITKWKNALQELEHAAEKSESAISRRSEYASSHVVPDETESASRANINEYQSLIQNAQTQISLKQSALAELQANLEAAIGNPKSGIRKGSEGYYQMLAEIQSVENEIDSLNANIIGYSNSISEAYMDIFDNVTQSYEDKLALADSLAETYNNALDLAEAKGYLATESYYKMLQDITSDNIKELKKEKQALSNILYESLSSGEIQQGSKDWYDMTQRINETTHAIEDAEAEMQEFLNSIREIKWERFDYLQERISKVSDEAEFFISLMEDMKMFDDKGKFTAEGTATLGMHGLNYNVFMKQADDYAAELKSVSAELANDPNNTKLIQQKEEFLSLQQQSILAAKNEKQAIKNLVSEGFENELASLKELIDNYTEALDSQKDLYDYQKKISEQTKNISSLEKQLAAYQNDASEEAKAKIQKIKTELESAKEDLEETQYDQYISDQKKLLDTMYEEYEKILNERLDNIDVLMEEMIAAINSSKGDINKTLHEVSESVGYSMNGTMENIWGNAGASIQTLALYDENFKSQLTSVNETLNNIAAYVESMKEKADEEAELTKKKTKQEADDKKKKETDAKKKAGKNSQNTKPDAQKAVKSENAYGIGSAPLASGSENSAGNEKKNKDKKSSDKKKDKKKQSAKKLKTGDHVTFKSGVYYSSSDGSSPTGTKYRGKKVYITSISSGASKPYHISIGKKLGSQDLGWLTKSQLGYAKGAKHIRADQFGWTNENWQNGGAETIVRKSDGAILTPLPKDSRIYNAMASETMWHAANHPADFVRRYAGSAGVTVSNTPSSPAPSQISIGDTTFSITLPNVKNYEEFKRAMQQDKTFEQFIQSITISPMTEKRRNTKNKFTM